MIGVDVGREGRLVGILWIGGDTVQDGRKACFAEEVLIGYELGACYLTFGAKIQGVEIGILYGRNFLDGADIRADLVEIPLERPFPTEGIDSVIEGSREQLFEALNSFDTLVVGR